MTWAVLVWLAVGIGGAMAVADWGLVGFDCQRGPGRIEIDGPCPVSPDPTISEAATHMAAGAIRLGLAAFSVGYAPAVAFALLAVAVGWVLGRLDVAGAYRLAPWVTLIIGAAVSVVVLVRSEFVTALWAWLGLVVPIGLTAIGIERASRPGSYVLGG